MQKVLFFYFAESVITDKENLPFECLFHRLGIFFAQDTNCGSFSKKFPEFYLSLPLL